MSRPLRPLLPLPSDPHQPAGPPNPPSPSVKKRQTVIAACEACRRRKSRCNVERPRCSSCITRNTKCEYDTISSETHSQALKRKYDELQSRKSSFEEVFEILKSKPEDEAQSILQRIRDGADAETIVRHVQNADLLIQLSLTHDSRSEYDEYELPFIAEMPPTLIFQRNEYLYSTIYQSTLKQSLALEQQSLETNAVAFESPQDRKIEQPYQNLYLKPYHNADLIDDRLSLAEASPWTSIINDNDLFKKLLKAYFLHDYPWTFFFNRDYFLADLVSGGHEHCSALLVNAVLAIACKSYSGIPNRVGIWNPHNLGYRFLAEAKRLWELDQDQSSKLTTVQASCIIHLTCNLDGIDRIGLKYLTHAVEMAKRMNVFSRVNGTHDSELQHAREFTAWALFNWQAMLCYYFRKPPHVTPPKTILPDPDEEPGWYGEIKIQYPSDPAIIPTNFSYLAKYSIKLRIIVQDISDAAFNLSGRAKLSQERAIGFISRTKEWFHDLPECLNQQNIVTPAQLKLHMEYHYLMINLLEPIVSGRHATAVMVDDQTAQEALSLSLLYLETVVRLYYLRHSFESHDPFLVQVLVLLAHHTLTKLSSQTREEANYLRSTVILCVKGLRDQSRNFYAAEIVYRLLRSMTTEDAHLLAHFVETREHEDNEPLKEEYVQSDWPLPITRIDQGPTSTRLENLVRKHQLVGTSSVTARVTPGLESRFKVG